MNFSEQQLLLFLAHWKSNQSVPPSHMITGKNNTISEVDGVTVGHSTLADGKYQTGVTAILPNQDNLFQYPLPCGVAILNGFGKSAGLVQIEELGQLETPILLTNTLSVGTCLSALIRHSIKINPQIGREQSTVNAVVMECNDGYLNDIQALAVTEQMVEEALANANAVFARGAVGAGRGMSTFGLKGGIGTASRKIGDYTLGVLVLSNFGRLPALTISGVPLGEAIEKQQAIDAQKDKGSIITIMATDAPLDARQLKRVAKRSGAGLGRLGSYWGHGSGDIALAFSTQRQKLPIQETELDEFFAAAADATEFAVLDAMLQAEAVTGRDGHCRMTLSQALDALTNAKL